jgi:hypothetical protein
MTRGSLLSGGACQSSKRWVVDRTTVQQARAVDRQYVDDPQHIELLNIFFGNGAPHPHAAIVICAE